MNNRFKILPLIIVLSCSSLALISPVGESAPVDQIYETYPFIEIEYNESLIQETVIPYSEPVNIPIIVKAQLQGTGVDLLEDIPFTKRLGGKDALAHTWLVVHLSIENISDGCYASISPPLIRYRGPSEEFQTANARLSFTIDKYFPAFSLKKVRINASVERLAASATLVRPATYYKEVPFQVGYYSQLSFSYPESNVKDIQPHDTAIFPIEVENWGNTVSNVYIDVMDVPEGWQANIKDNITLETNLYGEDVKEKVLLSVKPPINLGYYEDRAVITVKMTPVFYNNSNFVGNPHYLNFIVQSKGVATPGFEIIIFISAIILIFVPLFRVKNGSKQKRGGTK